MDKYHVLYVKSDYSFSVIEKLDNYFAVLVNNIDNAADAQKVAEALNAQEAPSE